MLPYQPAHDIPFFVHQVRLFVCLYVSMWDLQTNFYFFFSVLSVNQTPTRPQAEASGDIDEGETGANSTTFLLYVYQVPLCHSVFMLLPYY